MTNSMFILFAFGLAMDAFAVSITNGMCYRMHIVKNALASGLAFGLFQGLMPWIGYLAGHTFYDVMASVDHWIALVLLACIGGHMIWEAKTDKECITPREFSYKTLLLQAVATSIDALAVGVTLGMMQADLWTATSTIAQITFICSFLGVFIGKSFGNAFKNKAEILGGVILICIGIRIALQHLGWFPAI